MIATREAIVPGWPCREGVYTYPLPPDAKGFLPWGFDRVSDSALDMMGWAGFDCLLDVPAEGPVCVRAAFADGRSAEARLALTAGRQALFLALDDFCIPLSRDNIWRFLQSVAVEGAQPVRITALRSRALVVRCDVRGRSAACGQSARYRATVASAADRPLMVAVRQACVGWESMIAEITPERFVLQPGQEQAVEITLTVPMETPAGGHEQTDVLFTADGDSTTQQRLTLHTMSALTHPYIYHDAAGWREAGRRGRELPQFAESYAAYLRAADGYTVAPPERDKPYCYPTQVELELMSCAYVYGMTGERAYAEKIAGFFRQFTGAYMERQRGCSQSYVQEGHFFQHLAICYDLIHGAGVLSPQEHADIERCFRFYMEVLDQHLHNGHISNWLISEMTGALYCALALQDCERALRFAMGPGGMEQQLIYGTFGDGWWHECSVSYNTWVSSMFLHTARALRLIGIDWVHRAFPVAFGRHVDATWLGQAAPVRFDMDNERRGGNRRICLYIKDLFDAPLPFLDARGVIFGVCDSYERRLEGVHFGSTYELAYQYYHDPRYVPIIRAMDAQDCVFGVEALPACEPPALARSACADNIGIAMLRSAAPGRAPAAQLQAVLRYGSHGHAHGHFDIASLLAVSRYGRSFFNPECVWWGYPHFMYKFYVQNSMTKNMVVVDEKHQNVADSRLCLFAAGERIAAACVETNVTWSYPPFGGMVYDENESLAERCRFNGCTLPVPDGAPAFGTVTGFTEPILTRRLLCVCDDYLVLFDALQGTQPHRYSNLFQIKGFEGLTGSAAPAGRTRRMSDDPLGDAQFVTDCQHYEADGPTCARFATRYGEGEDMRGTRSECNEPGVLKMDVRAAWPPRTHQIIGLTAEDHHMYIPVRYAAYADQAVADEGAFDAWLGYTGAIHCDLTGASELTLTFFCPPLYTEQYDPFDSKQGLFLGSAVLTLADGTARRLCDLPMRTENIDPGCGIGRDYENGRVLLTGLETPDAIPVSPADHQAEAVLRVDLNGLGAVRFDCELGADAFPGDEQQRRRTYAIRTEGTAARFITVIEPYEREPVIRAVAAADADSVTVTLADGRTQTIRVSGLAEGVPGVALEEGGRCERVTGEAPRP